MTPAMGTRIWRSRRALGQTQTTFTRIDRGIRRWSHFSMPSVTVPTPSKLQLCRVRFRSKTLRCHRLRLRSHCPGMFLTTDPRHSTQGRHWVSEGEPLSLAGNAQLAHTRQPSILTRNEKSSSMHLRNSDTVSHSCRTQPKSLSCRV